MKIEVKENPKKLVLFWISREEGTDKIFIDALKPQFKAWKAKGYQAVLMESGTGNLEDSMYQLMKQNYVSLAKRQLADEKA